MTRTYYVTRFAGQVRRLDDLTLPWVDISVAHQGDFLDVMSVPGASEKVIVVGRVSGIFSSNDSGATWTQAVGTYVNSFGTEFPEIWIVDDQVSYIAGGQGGHVFKSIDGGITYDILTAHPTFGGGADGDTTTTAIHFINTTTGVVCNSIGGQTTVWKTTDGGSSWTILNGGNILGLAAAGGVHISTDEQTIVVQTLYGIWRSTDAGVTFVQVLDLTVDQPLGSGLHLTWIDDSTMWVVGIGDTVRKSIDGGATWSIIRPWNPTGVVMTGAHFYDTNNGFIDQIVSIHSTNDTGVTSTLSESIAVPAAIWTEIVIDPPADPCYQLINCADVNDIIFTGDDLSGVVGQVVVLADEDGNEIEGCWFVSENLEPCDSTEVVEVNIFRCYEDCDSCLPEPEPIRVAKPRAVLPNYTTGNCDPAIVEKAFCAFADLMHKEVMSKRFMIANCCPKDDALIWIRKEKIKLKLIESENPTPDPCNPVCSEYEMFLQPGYSAITTYTDCNEQEQTLKTPIAGKIQQLTICSLNTNPPNVVVYDDQNEEFDTFVLLPVGECTP